MENRSVVACATGSFSSRGGDSRSNSVRETHVAARTGGALLWFRGLASAALLLSTLTAAQAEAQAEAQEPAPTVDLESATAELSSIDSDANTATNLYIAGAVLHVLGISATVTGVVLSAGCLLGCPGAYEAGTWTALVGGPIALAVGTALVVPAIVLDIRSGARRRRLNPSAPDVQVGIGPAGVSLSGSF